MCYKCRVNEKNVVVSPCNHFCLCFECSQALEKCYLCESVITQKVKIYPSWFGHVTAVELYYIINIFQYSLTYILISLNFLCRHLTLLLWTILTLLFIPVLDRSHPAISVMPIAPCTATQCQRAVLYRNSNPTIFPLTRPGIPIIYHSEGLGFHLHRKNFTKGN